MQSKIFNHEEFVRTLDTKDILVNINNLPCNCTTSPFTDPNHGHIVTEDISKETVMQRSQIQGTNLH